MHTHSFIFQPSPVLWSSPGCHIGIRPSLKRSAPKMHYFTATATADMGDNWWHTSGNLQLASIFFHSFCFNCCFFFYCQNDEKHLPGLLKAISLFLKDSGRSKALKERSGAPTFFCLRECFFPPSMIRYRWFRNTSYIVFIQKFWNSELLRRVMQWFVFLSMDIELRW